MPGIVVAVDSESVSRPKRLFKIIPYSRGGFAVVMPYHGSRAGVLTKYTANYQEPESWVDLAQSETYKAEDRAKLSFHVDGFTQFSSERTGRILSGRDPVTGEPRGLGLVADPLDALSTTGPTFALTVGGLDNYDDLGTVKQGDLLALFTDEDIHDRTKNGQRGQALTIEGFIFSHQFVNHVRPGARGTRLPLWDNRFVGGGAHFDYRVVAQLACGLVLALLVSHIDFDGAAASGFWSLTSRGDGTHLLSASYGLGTAQTERTLDYRPE